MKKKILFFAAALLGVCNAYAVVDWDGTSIAWTEGEGTAVSPYIISSPSHLAYLASQVNAGTTYSGAYFKQTQDFNLQNKTRSAIGTDTYPFEGVYDGGEKYISDMYSSTTLFEYINNAEIKNLTIKGSSTLGVGASLVGNTTGDCTLTNCHNQCNVSSAMVSCGGLVREAKGTRIALILCSNTGNCGTTNSSKVDTSAGGLIGKTSCDNTYISQCFNSGTISSYYVSGYSYYNYTSGDFIGNSRSTKSALIEKSYSTGTSYNFFVGLNYGNENNNNITIKGCYSKGNYTVEKNCYDASFTYFKTLCCYFVGNVTVSGSCSQGMTSDLEWNAQTCYVPYNSIIRGNNIAVELMKDKWFLSQINVLDEYFTMDLEGINDGYPILKWQAGTRYTITATCDANRGTVTGGGEYPNGYTATLTATPKPGCTFVGWSDGETANPRYINVAGEATYTAQFTKSSYTIYINQDCTSNIE